MLHSTFISQNYDEKENTDTHTSIIQIEKKNDGCEGEFFLGRQLQNGMHIVNNVYAGIR